MTTLDNINLLIQSDRLDEAMTALNALLADTPEDCDALYMRGKLWWRLGERSRATSDYAHAATINPHHRAAAALDHARTIENFFNPDLLNP